MYWLAKAWFLLACAVYYELWEWSPNVYLSLLFSRPRREISALEAENYSLERQLFSYQKSIAYSQARPPNYGDETRSSNYPDDTRSSNYPDESHPDYPEQATVPPVSSATRNEYSNNMADPDNTNSYYMRPIPDAQGYQQGGQGYPSDPHTSDYHRAPTPSYPSDPSGLFQSGSFINGKRDYEAREYSSVGAKSNIDNREYPNGKKDLEGRTDFANPKREFDARDFSPRDFNYEGYDRNFPNQSDYAWVKFTTYIKMFVNYCKVKIAQNWTL